MGHDGGARAWMLALGGMAVVLGAGTAMGCSSAGPTDRPPMSSLHEGLNVFESRANWGMNAAYVKNGSVVYVQTRIGPLTPEYLRQSDPDTPLHEVDVRFVDVKGNTFAAQRGGDEFIDPTWSPDMSNHVDVSPADRDAWSLLAREASQVVKATLQPEMAEHVNAVFNTGSYVPSLDPRMQTEAANLRAQGVGAYTSYTHYAKLYYKCLAACLGAHSAVEAIEWNGSTWDWWVNTCNHGSCAQASGMTYQCQSSAGGRSNTEASYFSGENSGSISTVSGACSTGYAWFTNGSNHNCNDDSWFEIWQVKNNKTGSRGTQSGTDNGGYHYACGGGADDSGDLNEPECW
jgi:hypothetical protein